MHTDRAAGSLIAGIGLILAGSGLRADDGPSDKDLARHGLRRNGALLVLQAESAVHAKAEEVRLLMSRLGRAVEVQRSTMSEKEYQETLKRLAAEINELNLQSRAATQTMNSLPRSRRGRYLANNIVADEYQELGIYRNQLQMEINRRKAALDQLRSKPFDRKERIKADNEVRERLEALHQATQEMRRLVDDVRAKYEGMARDPQVREWLETPEGPARIRPKLGPSRAFRSDEKLLERAEREARADEPMAPVPQSARKGQRAARARRPAGAPGAASPF